MTTNFDGYYSTTYKITSSNEFRVRASFAGDSTYASASSDELTITPLNVYAHYPTCTITEANDFTYYKADTTTIFYRQVISDSGFKVSVDPDAATSTVRKVNFPDTTSTGNDVLTPTGTRYYYTYAIRTGSEFSGTATVTVQYTDGQTAVCTFNVGLDIAAPVTTFSKQQTSENGYTIALDCSDGSGSGCSKTFYCLTSTCTPKTSYAAPFTQTCAGTCYVRFYSQDNVGNQEDVHEEVYGPTSSPSS